jgi:Tol biopolymer transport system component
MSTDGFDELMTAWFEQRARGISADRLLEATLERTTDLRPIPAWRLPERWHVGDAVARRRRRPGLVLAFAVVALALVLAAVAILSGAPKLPPPFGVAAPGLVAYVADSAIWVAASDGSSARRLTNGDRIDNWPTWSRDGTRIVFKRLPTEGSEPDWAEKGDIYVVDLATGTETLVDARTDSPSPFSWSPDSQAITYSRDSRTGPVRGPPDGQNDQVFVARLDGSQPMQVTHGALAGWGPAWGPNDLIAFVRGFPTIDGIWVTRPDGSGQRKLTRRAIQNFDAMEWTPDGTTIVYASDTGGPQSISSVGLEGSDETLLTMGRSPAVSPDGRRITFLRQTQGSQSRIYVVNIDGTGARGISDDGSWLAPRWSPDGTRIVAVDGRANQPPAVVVLDPDGVESVTSFELPPGEGFGRSDAPSWQRIAR